VVSRPGSPSTRRRPSTLYTTTLTSAWGTLLIGPVLLGVFWFAGSMASPSPFAIIFKVSFWLGLVAYPMLVISSFREAAKPGPRKVVYGVNAGRLVRKVLRGTDDPLWSATEAPADLDAIGGRDRTWQRGKDLTVRLSDGDLVVDERHKQSFPSSGTLTFTEKITPSEFPALDTFQSLVQALGLGTAAAADAPADRSAR